MKNHIGLGLAAVVATTSLAFAGGEGEGEKEKAKAEARKNADTQMLEKLANSPGQAQNVEVKAKPGSGITFSVGEEFSLRIKNRVQVLWRYSDFDNGVPDTNSFSIKQARTDFQGHVYDKTKTFKVQLDWARDQPMTDILLDAWFNWDFYESENGENDIGFRLGLQKPHFGREFQGTSANLENTTRSLASQIFSGFRIVGAWLHGTHMEGEKLHWWAGVGNADPAGASTAVESGQNASNPNNELNWFFDVRFDPFGDVGDENYSQADLDYTEEAKGSVGASFMLAYLQPTGVPAALTNGDDVQTYAWNLYTAWHFQGLSAMAEAFFRDDESDFLNADSHSSGYAVSGGYALQPAEEGGPQWGFSARWSMFKQDDVPLILANTPLGTIGGVGVPGDINELTGTISNYYKKNNLKSQLSLRWQGVDPDAGFGQTSDNYFVDVLFQWIF